jgi:uncharacterized protein DUF6615
MTLKEIFEKLASDTWERMAAGYSSNISQGEETITDINLLEIERAGFDNVRVVKTNKNDESVLGTDWEWWIGGHNEWLRFAVQAKKGYPKNGSPQEGYYRSINQKVKNGTAQIDILEKYAKLNGAIPLYCFYNSIVDPPFDPQKHWHCNENPEKHQLGCSLTPLSVAKKANTRGNRNFNFIHSQPETIPWRCLLKFFENWPQNILPIGQKKDGSEQEKPTANNEHGFFSHLRGIYCIYPSPPITPRSSKEMVLDESFFSKELIDERFSDREIQLFPKRIMTIEITS